MNDKHIVIVGFMGCGKTVVAKELARLLEKPCVDLDARIQDLEGRTPAQIIKDDNEQTFRAKETQALRSLLAEGDTGRVMALGGGAWTVAVNRELVRSFHSTAIWLDTPFAICWQRIQQDGNSRPLAPSRTAAATLFAERLPLYRLADIHVAVTDETPVQIAETIAALLQQGSFS